MWTASRLSIRTLLRAALRDMVVSSRFRHPQRLMISTFSLSWKAAVLRQRSVVQHRRLSAATAKRLRLMPLTSRTRRSLSSPTVRTAAPIRFLRQHLSRLPFISQSARSLPMNGSTAVRPTMTMTRMASEQVLAAITAKV